MNGLFNLPEAEPVEEEIQLPTDATHFMQAIFRDPAQPITRRMRAAIAALPFEHPKLSVNANTEIGNFASQMEAVMRRSGKSTVIHAKARYDTSAPLPVPRQLSKPEPIETDPSQGGFRRRL